MTNLTLYKWIAAGLIWIAAPAPLWILLGFRLAGF